MSCLSPPINSSSALRGGPRCRALCAAMASSTRFCLEPSSLYVAWQISHLHPTSAVSVPHPSKVHLGLPFSLHQRSKHSRWTGAVQAQGMHRVSGSSDMKHIRHSGSTAGSSFGGGRCAGVGGGGRILSVTFSEDASWHGASASCQSPCTSLFWSITQAPCGLSVHTSVKVANNYFSWKLIHTATDVSRSNGRLAEHAAPGRNLPRQSEPQGSEGLDLSSQPTYTTGSEPKLAQATD